MAAARAPAAAERPGLTPAGIPGCAPGCAPRRRKEGGGGGRSRELAAGLREEGCVWSRCALRAESASRYPQPGDVKAGCAAQPPSSALCSSFASAFLCQPPSSSVWTAPRGSARPAASGLQPAPPRPSPDSPRAPRLQTPLVFRMPPFAFARGKASFNLKPGVITGDTLSPPRRPKSSRIRSAWLEGRTGHSTWKRLRCFPFLFF